MANPLIRMRERLVALEEAHRKLVADIADEEERQKGPSTVDLGDGYEGSIYRGPSGDYWIGDIHLPAGHCCIGVHRDIVNVFLPKGTPMPPVPLTHGKGNIFGVFEKPYWMAPERFYLSYDETLTLVRKLKTFFVKLETDHRETVIKTNIDRLRCMGLLRS